MGSPFSVLFVRVPHYFGDLKRDPSLENYFDRLDTLSSRAWGLGCRIIDTQA